MFIAVLRRTMLGIRLAVLPARAGYPQRWYRPPRQPMVLPPVICSAYAVRQPEGHW